MSNVHVLYKKCQMSLPLQVENTATVIEKVFNNQKITPSSLKSEISQQVDQHILAYASTINW